MTLRPNGWGAKSLLLKNPIHSRMNTRNLRNGQRKGITFIKESSQD